MDMTKVTDYMLKLIKIAEGTNSGILNPIKSCDKKQAFN